jgi:hypothetical protein
MPVFPDVILTYKTMIENASIIGVNYQFWLLVLPRMCARNIDGSVEHQSFEKACNINRK